MLDIVALAFQNCPKLSNLIIESHDEYRDIFRPRKKQVHVYRDLRPVATERGLYNYRRCLCSMQLDIWDILKPVHDVNRALKSLVLLDRYLTCPPSWSIPTTSIFQSLKYLRHHGSSSDFLAGIVASAPKLESIGIIGEDGGWQRCTLQSLIGRHRLENLRACTLTRLAFEEDDLVQFFLRHSNTLRVLRIHRENYASTVNWPSFVIRV
jgi:hypothetical protein